jgi:hypothetical protein
MHNTGTCARLLRVAGNPGKAYLPRYANLLINHPDLSLCVPLTLGLLKTKLHHGSLADDAASLAGLPCPTIEVNSDSHHSTFDSQQTQDNTKGAPKHLNCTFIFLVYSRGS